MSFDNPYTSPQSSRPPSGQQQPTQPYGGQPPYGPPQQPGYAQGMYGQQPYGGPGQFGPQPALAGWGKRVGAYLIDGLVGLPAYLLMIPGYVAIIRSAETTTECSTAGYCRTVTTGGSVSPPAAVLMLLGFVLLIGLEVWNRWIRGGKGQSIGKKVLGISLVSASSGRPIGAGLAFVRDIAHVADSLPCDIGFLWPLWDSKRQTFADKIVSTLVIEGPPPGDMH